MGRDYVQNHNGRSFQVKNLGWLLRHWKEVESFDLAEVGQSPHNKGFMVAHLRGGGTFMSHWASYSIMRDWVRRPVFCGVPYFGCLLTLTVEAEDCEVRGNAMASGDDAADKAVEDEILARLDSGDIWAWAYVRVTATRGDFKGEDSLGACTYANERDFTQLNGGYFCDMVRNAIDGCKSAVYAACRDTKETC